MKKLLIAGAASLPLLAVGDPTVPADVQTILDTAALALTAIVAAAIVVRNYRLVFKLIGKVFGWVFGKG